MHMNNSLQSKVNAKRPFVLIVCDGWGEVPETKGNAIAQAKTPNFDKLRSQWPHVSTGASGEAVGLPAGQQGNSEVGHLTIGTGRILRQPLSRQIYEINSGHFYENEVLIDAIEQAKSRNKALHIIGLVSPGGVHSYSDSALALVKLAKRHNLSNVFIHAITDGRDTKPTSALQYITEFEAALSEIGVGSIASIGGRYYGMDRDNRWDRVQEAYEALTADEYKTVPSATEYITQSYAQDITDEFLRPVSIANTNGKRTRIEDGDVVIFFNFRPDRARQLSHALVDVEFSDFHRSRVVKDLHFVAFSEYDSALNVPIAFPKENAKNSLAEVLSAHGLTQYHVAETEKYAHVTYFLNGGQEDAFPGETRKLIQSPKVATYDLAPEMSARAVADDVVAQIKAGKYDLIAVNFANADMVGHTGNLQATIQAIETLDSCLDDVIDAALAQGGVALMTADHGNAEYKIDYETGKPLTAHTTNPVPVLLCGTDARSLREDGGLSDIAPTVLAIMNLPIPPEMTGKSLIE